MGQGIHYVADIVNFPEPRLPRRPTVLVVDDEFLVRNVLSEILNDAGFQVLQADNASAAITMLGGMADVDLVFSDVKMPGMDGFELANWVADHQPGLPVILASGYVGKSNRAHDLTGAEVLRKPFDFDMVIEKIRDTISRRRQLRA